MIIVWLRDVAKELGRRHDGWMRCLMEPRFVVDGRMEKWEKGGHNDHPFVLSDCTLLRTGTQISASTEYMY